MHNRFIPSGRLVFLILLAISVLILMLTGIDRLNSFRNFIPEFKNPNYNYLILALVLMPVNWWLEYCKYTLMSGLGVKYRSSVLISSLLSGVFFSAVTPVKSGDYGGRLVWLKRDDWPAALSAVFWGNWCQFLWLMLAGMVGFLYMTAHTDKPIIPYSVLVYGIIICVMLMLIIFWFYVRTEVVKRLINLLPFKNKVRSLYLNFIKVKDVKLLYKTLIFAGLRYLVYVMQSFALVCVFDNTISALLLMSGVVSVFFVQALLPVLSVMGLIGRTGIAIFVLNRVGVSEVVSSVSSVLLWVINILIPALVGLYFIVHKFATKENEKQESDII